MRRGRSFYDDKQVAVSCRTYGCVVRALAFLTEKPPAQTTLCHTKKTASKLYWSHVIKNVVPTVCPSVPVVN